MDQPTRVEPRRGLEEDLDVDVVVVGGGIAGCSVVYHLARKGIEAVLLERDAIGGGATSAAVGILSPPMRQPFHETSHDRGEDAARAIWEFALRSVSGLGEALGELGVADDVRLDLSGGHVLAESHSEHAVRQSFDALEAAGLPVSWMDAREAAAATSGRGFLGGYRIEGGGSVDPAAAARALAAGARGAVLVEAAPVESVERAGKQLVCRTPSASVRCQMVIYATHTDSRRFSTLLGDEIVPIRGQGAALEAPEGVEVPGSFATHWKLNVWRRAGDEILVSGWRHDAWDRAYWKARPRIDEHLQGDLVAWFEASFPAWGPIRVKRRWSGVFGWTADYLPLVGPLPGAPDEWVISGFSGGGLPFAFESGRALAAAVAGEDPVPGIELLNPRRFT